MFTPWLVQTPRYERGWEWEGTWHGKGKTHLLSDDRDQAEFYLCCPDSPAQGLSSLEDC